MEEVLRSFNSYARSIVEEHSQELPEADDFMKAIERLERLQAFHRDYYNKMTEQAEQILAGFSGKEREEIEQALTDITKKHLSEFTNRNFPSGDII